MGVEVSLVIPAYNEESSIEEAVNSATEELSSFLEDEFEIIIVEGGSTDKTREISQKLASRERVNHICFNERKGRGKALEEAFSKSKGDIIAYMDADLSTDIKHLEELIEPVKDGKVDVSVGSRRMPDSSADRRQLRKLASWGYNNLARILLESEAKDHQCGFKAFDRGAIEDISKYTESNHWFWDTEVLVRAKQHSYKTREIPVNWEKAGDSSVNLAYDTIDMGIKLLKLARKINQQPSTHNNCEDTGGK
jgi:glycosyltransferase involved in cell wall biosynthesis